MFESEFLFLMPHTVHVTRVLRDGSGTIIRDLEGNAQFDVANIADYRCRVVGKGLSLRRPDRADMTVIYDVYLGKRVFPDGSMRPVGNDVFTIEDHILLDGDPAWVDQTPLIFAVARLTDEDGHHHVKIQCGWMYHRQGQ